jgi:hypothetical protein
MCLANQMLHAAAALILQGNERPAGGHRPGRRGHVRRTSCMPSNQDTLHSRGAGRRARTNQPRMHFRCFTAGLQLQHLPDRPRFPAWVSFGGEATERGRQAYAVRDRRGFASIGPAVVAVSGMRCVGYDGGPQILFFAAARC